MRAMVPEREMSGIYVKKEQSQYEQNQDDNAGEPEDKKKIGFVRSNLFDVHTCVMVAPVIGFVARR
jgi:hypothetical protein